MLHACPTTNSRRIGRIMNTIVHIHVHVQDTSREAHHWTADSLHELNKKYADTYNRSLVNAKIIVE